MRMYLLADTVVPSSEAVCVSVLFLCSMLLMWHSSVACLRLFHFDELLLSNLLCSLQTLELLYRITNGQNVTVIVEKMLDFLRQSKDEYTTIDLVGKVAELAEKYPFTDSD